MLSFFFAKRYLFSKKSTNAINLITGISILGITIGTAALILELAVFNGFEELLSGMFNKFNPELKITSATGKFFKADEAYLKNIQSISEVKYVTKSIEEVAMFEHDDNIAFATLKGVTNNYNLVTNFDSTLIAGSFLSGNDSIHEAILGVSVKNKLNISLNNPFSRLKVYMVDKNKSALPGSPFKVKSLVPVGIFSYQQDYDNDFIFAPFHFVEKLIEKRGMASSVEIRLQPEADVEGVKHSLLPIIGNGVEIKDRYQQDEAFFKLMNIEKWMFYALFALTLILIAFNIIGALWMIVLEKRQDIAVLKSMGASDDFVKNIFLSQGVLISAVGVLVGAILALGLYLYHVKYGLIIIPEGFVIDKYPMKLRFSDFIVSGATMLVS